MDFGFSRVKSYIRSNVSHFISASMLIGSIGAITVLSYVAEAQSPEAVTTSTTVISTTLPPQTTTTTLPPVTTTTINLNGVDWNSLRQMEIESMRQKYGKCGEYHDLAISIGWPEEEWKTLSQVMWRESRCDTAAWNGADAGLMQINRVHTEWASQMGFAHPDDLFTPENNLLFAFRLWETSGWKPWRFSGEVPS
jgi:hypothetical protein